MDKKKGKLKRGMGILLAVAMLFNTLPISGFAVSASEKQETGLCEHHTEHTAECGYTEAQPCTHEHSDECYEIVTECVHTHTDECYPEMEETDESTEEGEGSATPSDAESREPENCSHQCSEESGCISRTLDCHHGHDESCGYAEAHECGYVCEICNGTEPENAGDNAKGTDIDTVETKSTEPENAKLCAHHKEHTGDCGYGEESPCTYDCPLCPIEDLIAALPDEVTEDNAKEVRAQLDEILDLYRELTGEEQEQLDISHCLELQEQLDVNIPSLIAEAVSYRDCDANGKNWEEKTCETYTEVTSGTTSWNTGWYVVRGSVTISSRVTVSGDVHLILTDGCVLDAQQGITVEPGNSLTVYAQSGGSGSLTATASERAAGIGGSGNNKSGGTITINGGVVTATGGSKDVYEGGAGIGGGYNASDVTVVIHGGTVNAAGGVTSAPGIGARNGGTVTITGGTVTATNFGKASVSTTGGTVNGKTYGITVTFVMDTAAVTIPEQNIGEGETATRPGNPNGYVLSFFSDASYTTPFDFGTAITQSVTIYVKCEVNDNYLVSVTTDGVETKYTSSDSFVNAIKGASGEVDVKLLQDVDLGTSSLTIPEGVTLTLDCGEYTLTSSGTYTIYVDGNFCFKGGTLLNTSSLYVTVWVENGSFTMSGGTVNGTYIAVDCAYSDVSINISGGKVIGGTMGLNVRSGTVKLSGGTYSSIYASGKSAADILADGCALQVGDGLISRDTSLSGRQNDVSVVNPCPHTGVLQDNEDGTHGGNCPYCGTEFEAAPHTPDGSNVCTGCKTPLKVQVEIDGTTTYYGGINAAWVAAKGHTATVTLLADVTASTLLLVTGGDDITFDGGEFTLTGPSNKNKIIDIFGGKLTVTGGTLKTGENTSWPQSFDITISGGELVVTGGSLEAGTGCVGLAVVGNAPVKLSGGTFHGIRMRTNTDTVGRLLLNYGSTNATEKHYAYFENGQPVNLGTLADQNFLTGTVTVAECTNHVYTEQSYSHDTGSTKHTQTCAACGAVEEVDCEYTKSEASDGQVRTKVCDCGAMLTASLTDADNLVYNGTAHKPSGVTFMVDGVIPRNDVANAKTYGGNKDAGTGTVAIQGTQGVFWGQFQLTFPIAKATPVVTWNGGSTQTLTYTGQAAAVTADVQLVNSETGTVSYSYAEQGSDNYTPGLPTDAGTYSVKASFAEQKNYFAADAELTLTINKADAEITVVTGTYNKTFGDAAFTLDVTDNNTEADVQYEVTAGADVLSVSNGTVTIQNAGMAAITVSLPASTNYNAAASKTITVNVAQKGGYTVAEMNRSYLHSRENTGSIDLAALLPKDCGTVTYGTPATSGDVTYSAAPAVNDGILSYTLNSGNINDEGTITVTVATRNYEDITITVKVKLTDQIPVSLKTGTEVTLENNVLTFGEALSKLAFNEAEFVGDDGKTVAGTLAWKDAAATPNAGTTSAVWVFTPTDTAAYACVEGTAAITVNKAAPTVSAVPTVEGRVYDPSAALQDVERRITAKQNIKIKPIF